MIAPPHRADSCRERPQRPARKSRCMCVDGPSRCRGACQSRRVPRVPAPSRHCCRGRAREILFIIRLVAGAKVPRRGLAASRAAPSQYFFARFFSSSRLGCGGSPVTVLACASPHLCRACLLKERKKTRQPKRGIGEDDRLREREWFKKSSWKRAPSWKWLSGASRCGRRCT